MMTIGEVAALEELPVATARYYEKRGLIPEPPRTASGYRPYLREAVDRLRFVKRAQALEEIGELLTCASRTVRPGRRSTRAPARS